jgi:hypothetical protein
MADRIFLLGNGDNLQPMNAESYTNEDLLQTLLAKYPDLLGGDQIDEESPRRWLLVAREVGHVSQR